MLTRDHGKEVQIPPIHPTVDLARQMAMAGWKSAGDRSNERSISSYIRGKAGATTQQKQ